MTIHVQTTQFLQLIFFVSIQNIQLYDLLHKYQILFFCEFGILQSHSIILQKLHSCSINGFLHTALYFCNVPDTNLSSSIIFPKLLLTFKLYSFILTPNEFFLYWIRIHSFLHIRIYSKQMYHHFFPQRTGKNRSDITNLLLFR